MPTSINTRKKLKRVEVMMRPDSYELLKSISEETGYSMSTILKEAFQQHCRAKYNDETINID